MSVRLDPAGAATLVSPAGAADPLVSALYLTQYKKTLLNLRRVSAQLEAEAPDLAEQTGFTVAFRALAEQPATVQKAILTYPSAPFWVDVATDLLQRGSHLRFPEMHVAMHLEEFSRLAVAAAVLAGSDGFGCTTWTDQEGRLSLPGTGTVLETRPRRPYQRLRVEVRDGTVLARDPTGRELALSPRRVPVVLPGVELNALDPDLRLPGRADFVFPELGEESLVGWRSTFDEGWEWIERTSTVLAAELRLGVRALVPVASPATDVHISATFREAPGLIALSWTADASVMVEALVHEYHHQKLNALLNLDPLITGPSAEPLFYSPWRNDPRPLLGVLHGTYVFQAILEFWLRFLDGSVPHLYGERLRQRVHLVHGQALTGLQAIRMQAEMSALGVALLDAMEANLSVLAADLPAIDPTVAERLAAAQREHRSRWEAANSGLVERGGRGAPRAPVTPQPPGVAPGFDPGAALHARQPDDPVLEAVLRHRAAGDADALAALLASPDDGVAALAAAHAAYVDGDFARAAELYAACSARWPESAYLWQCLAFALRHLGRWDDAERVLTSLGALVTGETASSAGAGSVEERLQRVEALSTAPGIPA